MEVSNLTPRITLRGRGQDWERFLARGFLYFNAEEVRFRGMRGCGVTTKLRRAGEPFHDVGIDLDHDGVVCKESGEGKCCPERPLSSEELTRCNELLTASNQRWDIELDIDCDPRLKPCDSDGPEVDAPWPPERPEWESFTRMHASLSSCSGEEGVDSRMLGRYAHEPFVQLDPASPRTVQQALRWSFARDRVPRRAGSQVTGFPWSQASAGWDCSSGGVELALNLDGGLYNEGSVVLGEGASLSGSVFARGGVRALEGATWICPVRKLGRFPDPKWVDPPDYCADVHLPP